MLIEPSPQGDLGEPGGARSVPSPSFPPITPSRAGFYAFLDNGEIADPDEVDAMIASLQSLLSFCTSEEARIRLS